jgi:DNA-binding MarR family transcriptional regulator
MVEPRWLDEQEADAWLQMLAVVEHLPAAIDAQLKRDSGLGRFEYTVLAAASESSDRSVAMLHLSDLTNASISRLSHAVTRMVERGLVTRTRQGTTRYVTLTEAGWDALRVAAPGHVAEVRRLVFDRLPRGTASELASILRPIADQLRAASPRT